MLKNLKMKNYKYPNLCSVQNSSPAVVGSPFWSANKRVSGSVALRPNSAKQDLTHLRK